MDYDRYWRRAILGASAARCFAVTLRCSRALDDIFLAALLQDIAILGIDRTAPDFYRDLPRTASHREFAVYEMARLGIDHAELGGWLLRYWKLPEPLCRTVAWSHSPVSADRSTAAGMMGRCVALGSECVEMLLAPDATMHFASLARQASDWLGMDSAAVAEVMVKIVAEIPEIGRLFDTKLLQHDAAAAILDQARDLLLMRNLPALGQARSLRETSSKPEPRITELQEALQDDGQRDRLTGLYNRGYLDLMLRRELQAALSGNWPLSLVLVDLDDFQAINETRGREAGDSVLLSTAELIASVARDTDCVARFGDAQFVIVLPGLASAGAKILCERVITRLSRTFHEIGSPALGVTASVGLATHAPDKPCQRVSQLINAAERAACVAKNSNHHRQHKSGSVLTTVKT